MGAAELFFIAVGLSMDAFAVAVGKGMSMKKADWRKSLAVGLYFGFFQAVMPLAGFLAGWRFSDMITSVDHWIAFALLCFIGVRMIAGTRKKDGGDEKKSGGHSDMDLLKPSKMLPLAVATSIDALAVGVSFAFLQVSVIPAVLCIGATTLALSAAGVKIGNAFGAGLKSKAEIAGGIILVLMGFKILFEHIFA